MKFDSKTVGRVVLVVVVLAFGAAAMELARRLRNEPIQVHWGWLVASAVVLALGYTALAVVLARIIAEESGHKPGLLRVCELYFRGVIARYLPGKVGVPAVRMAAAPEFHVSVPFMAGTVVMETLASLATAGAVAALISVGPWAAPTLRAVTSGPWTLPLVLGICAFVIALAILDLRHYPAALAKFLRASDRTGPLLHVYWLLGCAVCWVAVGVASGLCALALSEGRDAALLAAAAGVLGPIVGFLAMVAPGGLGVREAFVVALLSPQIGGTRALAYGLVSRAMILATEFLLWVVARLSLAFAERSRESR